MSSSVGAPPPYQASPAKPVSLGDVVRVALLASAVALAAFMSFQLLHPVLATLTTAGTGWIAYEINEAWTSSDHQRTSVLLNALSAVFRVLGAVADWQIWSAILRGSRRQDEGARVEVGGGHGRP